MLETLVLGAVSSLVAEFITWLNARLSGTVLNGSAAWIVAALVAVVAACVKVFYLDGVGAPHDITTLSADLVVIWSVSQVFFSLVVKYFGITVPTPVPIPAPTQ